MAVLGISRIEPVRTISGNTPQTLTFPEAASQTYLQGAVLVFNASGFVAEAGANPTGILGIASEPGQNNAISPPSTGYVSTAVWLANSDTVFRANLVSVSAGAAVAANSVPNAMVLTPGNYPVVGGMYGLTKLSTGAGANNWVVDLAKNGGANRRVIITNYDPRDTGYPIGSDTYPVVEFIFFNFFTAFGMTS